MNFQAYTLESHNEYSCIQINAPDSSNRTPVHLCILLDTSASMDMDNKLNNVKQSIKFLLNFLTPQDQISVVTFSDIAKVINNKTSITPNEKENLSAVLSLIKSESNTNLSAGIITAQDCLNEVSSDVKQGILLLTDGQANAGVIHPPDIIRIVKGLTDKFSGTSISCVGYGTDHNAELLQGISSESGGSYYVVNDIENVAVVFGDILGALMSCTSQQVRVIMPPGTEVKTRYAVHNTSSYTEVVIGDMPASATAAFIAKLPTTTPISLKGYDILNHSTYELNTTINQTDDVTLQTNGEAHYLRFEVLTIIEKSRTMIINNPSAADIQTVLDSINSYITTITDYSSTHPHSLWNLLLSELNTCKSNLQNRNNLNRFHTGQVLSQHTAYLGMMRGLPAQTPIMHFNYSSQPPYDPNFQDENDDDPTSSNSVAHDISSNPIPPPVDLHRTFSNTVQRQISAQMHTYATPVAHTQSAPAIPVSALRRRNALGLMEPIQGLSQIQENDGSYDSLARSSNMLPLPPMSSSLLPLQRQQACPSDIPPICSPIRGVSHQSNTD